MQTIAVLGSRKDLGFLRFLENAFEKRGLKAQCVFAGSGDSKLRRIAFFKKPEILILFFRGRIFLF